MDAKVQHSTRTLPSVSLPQRISLSLYPPLSLSFSLPVSLSLSVSLAVALTEPTQPLNDSIQCDRQAERTQAPYIEEVARAELWGCGEAG